MSETFVPITQEQWEQEKLARVKYAHELPKRANEMIDLLISARGNLLLDATRIISELIVRVEELERELEDS